MTRSRITSLVCLTSFAAIPAGAGALPTLVTPPKLRVSVGGVRLNLGASAFLWKGQIADGIAIGQMKDLAVVHVRRGQTASLRIPYGAQKVTISEVVAGQLTGFVVKRARNARAITWTPRLGEGTANVEVFVNTKLGFASYVFALTRS